MFNLINNLIEPSNVTNNVPSKTDICQSETFMSFDGDKEETKCIHYFDYHQRE
jgi:hypothetical protein